MNSKAVLPMAVASELMCQAAIANNPELEFFGYSDMKLLKGVVLDKESELLKVFARIGEIIPPCGVPLSVGKSFPSNMKPALRNCERIETSMGM